MATLTPRWSVAIAPLLGGAAIALTPVAVSSLGVTAPWAYLLAALWSSASAVPVWLLHRGGAADGATYAWPARLLHPTAGFALAWLAFPAHAVAGLAALSAGRYLETTGLDPRATAAVIVIAFAALSLLSERAAAWALAVLVVAAMVGFGTFALVSRGEGAAPAAGDLLPTVLVLTVVTTGSTLLAELGPRAGRGRAMLLAPLVAGVLFAAVAFAAARAQLTSLTAIPTLPQPAWTVFLSGAGVGGLLAVALAHLVAGPRALAAAARAGWLGGWATRPGAARLAPGLLAVLSLAVVFWPVSDVLAAVTLSAPVVLGVLAALTLTARGRALASSPLAVRVVTVAAAVALAAGQVWLMSAGLTRLGLIAAAIWVLLGAAIVIARAGRVRIGSATSGHLPERGSDQPGGQHESE